MSVTIWHNPQCTKSRQALELLEARGIEPTVRHYLKDPPTTKELRAVLKRLGTKDAHDLVRRRDKLYGELGVANMSSAEALSAMAQHSRLIERPVVIVGDQARIGRPTDAILEILDAPPKKPAPKSKGAASKKRGPTKASATKASSKSPKTQAGRKKARSKKRAAAPKASSKTNASAKKAGSKKASSKTNASVKKAGSKKASSKTNASAKKAGSKKASARKASTKKAGAAKAAKADPSGHPAALLARYDAFIAKLDGVERKGKKIPYTSRNGHMFSFITQEGQLAVRLPRDAREAFVAKHRTPPCMQYGAVMKEYALVPEGLLANTRAMRRLLAESWAYIGTLKPKPTKRAK